MMKKVIVVFLFLVMLFYNFGPFLYFKKEVKAATGQSLILDLKAGWNMIAGSKDTVFNVSDISGCDIASGPWYWDHSQYKYIKADKIEPLRGYWIYVKSDCSASLSGGSSAGIITEINLQPGWNIISAAAEASFKVSQVNCSLKQTGIVYRSLFTWNALEKKYDRISFEQNMKVKTAYFVYVENNCKMSVLKQIFLSNLGEQYYCLIQEGPPEKACGQPQIIEKNGTPYCKGYNAKCEKNNQGQYKWNCNYQETPKPQTPGEWICTPGGWFDSNQYPNANDFIDAVCKGTDPVKLLVNIVMSALGGMILNEETITAIFGNEIAAIIKFAINISSCLLEKMSFDQIVNLAQNNPNQLSLEIENCVKYTIEIESKKILNSLINGILAWLQTQIEANLKLNFKYGIGLQIANFLKPIQDLCGVVNDAVAFGDRLLQHVYDTQSALLKDTTRPDRILNIISANLGIKQDVIEKAYGFINFLLNKYAQTKDLPLETIIADLEVNFDVWWQAYGQSPPVNLASFKQAIKITLKDVILKIQNELAKDEKAYKATIAFIDYLQTQGLRMAVILQQARYELENWKTNFASATGITLQLNVESLDELLAQIIGQFVVKMAKSLANELGISDQLINQTVDFFEWLATQANNVGMSIEQIANTINPSNINAFLSQYQKPVNTDPSLLAIGISQTAKTIKIKIQGEFNFQEELTKRVIKLANDMINNQKIDINAFINQSVADFNSAVKNFVTKDGPQIAINAAINFIKPIASNCFEKDTIVALLKFANFLKNIKNIDLFKAGVNITEDLLAQWVGEYLDYMARYSGLPIGLVKTIFIAMAKSDIFQDLIKGDIPSIIAKANISVNFTGTLSCPFAPPDPVKIICAVISSDNWNKCTIGTFKVDTGAVPNDNTIRAKAGGFARGVEIGLCDLPDFSVSLFGITIGASEIIQSLITNLTQQPRVTLGPLSWGPNKNGQQKLWLELPTHFRVNWDWNNASTIEGLKEARTNPDGLSHSYSGQPQNPPYYYPAGVCRFIVDFNVWPPVRPQINLWQWDQPTDTFKDCGGPLDDNIALDVIKNVRTCPP